MQALSPLFWLGGKPGTPLLKQTTEKKNTKKGILNLNLCIEGLSFCFSGLGNDLPSRRFYGSSQDPEMEAPKFSGVCLVERTYHYWILYYHNNKNNSEVWTRVLWILRVPPDKRAFSRAGMLVCQPWLWPDTFRHYQFRGITSIKSITSISSSTGITSSHGCGFARHTSPNKTDSYFFLAFSRFCGPSPVLRAFSGFAGLLRVCVLPQPLRARSF